MITERKKNMIDFTLLVMLHLAVTVNENKTCILSWCHIESKGQKSQAQCHVTMRISTPYYIISTTYSIFIHIGYEEHNMNNVIYKHLCLSRY